MKPFPSDNGSSNPSSNGYQAAGPLFSKKTLQPLWRPVPTLSGSRFVLCDGMNLLRLRGRDVPQLELVISILERVADRASDLLCIFDACASRRLRDQQSSHHADLFEHLLKQQSDFFIQVTGGTCADDVILAQAEHRDALIVSNDTFKQPGQREHYPWLNQEDRVIHANVVRQHIHIDGILLPVCSDLSEAVVRLEKRLSKLGKVHPLVER